MKKCIICNTEKEEDKFNIEHVIPESAGGSFEIDNVCEECNSLLGSTMDNNFLDNFFVKVYLSKFDIKSKRVNSQNYGLNCLQEKILKLKVSHNIILIIINFKVGNIIVQ